MGGAEEADAAGGQRGSGPRRPLRR
jgi:hypothetical protein